MRILYLFRKMPNLDPNYPTLPYYPGLGLYAIQDESVKWRALRALRALVPSMLACSRALVPKFLACPHTIESMSACPRARVPKILGVPSCLPCWRALVSSCLNFRRALVPLMLMFRTLLRDVTLEMFLESLKLSDPFFLNFILFSSNSMLRWSNDI